MGDFLEVLDFSPTSPKTAGAVGSFFVVLDETVFISGSNGEIFSSEGIVMPVAAETQAEDPEDEKNGSAVKFLSSEGIVMPLAVEIQADKEEEDANKSKIPASGGIVMPLAAEIHVNEDEKDVKLRLLHKWEEEMEADDETTSDEEDSSGCSSSDEDDPVPEPPKQLQEVEEEKPFIQEETEAEHKPQPSISTLRQCSLPGCVKTATMKGLCVAHGGSKRCEHPGCAKKALRSGKCFCHGGGSKCSIQGCTKQALIKGMCVAHSGNIAPQGAKGLGVKHFGRKSSGFSNGTSGYDPQDSGEGPKCARPRCINAAINKGLCIDHGGYVPCSVSGCVTRARVRDKCLAHAYRHPRKQAGVGERYRGYGGRARG